MFSSLEWVPLLCILYITHYSAPILQSTDHSWLCPGTDGPLRETATGRKNLTEHQYRAGFSSNGGVKHSTNLNTKLALFRSDLAWRRTPAKVWKLFFVPTSSSLRNFKKWEEEKDQEERKKKTRVSKICASCLQTWEMPLSALCCLGVTQIRSGCLSRLNMDQNRQRSKRYKAGQRSAATENTENAHTVEMCMFSERTYLPSHIDQNKKQ